MHAHDEGPGGRGGRLHGEADRDLFLALRPVSKFKPDAAPSCSANRQTWSMVQYTIRIMVES